MLSTAFLWFAGAGLVLMTAIIGWQVFARYALEASPTWAEQASLVLMIWYISLAAAAGVRERFHIRITAVEDAVTPAARARMEVISNLVVLTLGLTMAACGAELTIATWGHNIPTLSLPRGVAYVPISLAGLLIALFALEHILAGMLGRKVEPLWR